MSNDPVDNPADGFREFPSLESIACPKRSLNAPELREEMRWRTAFHEAGHALVAEHFRILVVAITIESGGARVTVDTTLNSYYKALRRGYIIAVAAGVVGELRTPLYRPEVVAHNITREAYITGNRDRAELERVLTEWNAAYQSEQMTAQGCFDEADAVLNTPFHQWVLPRIASHLHECESAMTGSEWSSLLRALSTEWSDPGMPQ